MSLGRFLYNGGNEVGRLYDPDSDMSLIHLDDFILRQMSP